MATIGYAQLPVPDGADAPATPGSLAALATALDPHLVQPVTDAADRTARLSAAPVGTVAVATDGTTWVKTVADTDTWAATWQPDPAWRDLTPADGYEAGTHDPQIRISSGIVYIRGRLVRTDGALIDGTNGVTVAVVPDDCVPLTPGTGSAFFSLTGPPLVGAGRFEVREKGDPNAAQLVFYSQDGAQDGGVVGTPWIDLSGYYWLD